MCYIELKNDKYETSEDLKHLLQYILRLDKTAEDSQRANTITNTLAGCQPACRHPVIFPAEKSDITR